jgi:hypothetical protein
VSDLEPIIKAIFLGVFILILLHTFYSALKSLFASSWPKANGEIVYAGILEEDDGESSTYKPVIEFKYKVKGKVYTSNTFAFGFMASSFRFLSSSIFKRYRNRPYVKVFYNPKKPSQGVLLTGIRFFHIFNVGIFGAILYFLGPMLGL